MKNEEEGAFKFAAKLISVRKRSVFEIRDRLKQKGYSELAAEKITKKLENSGYLDDRDFAASYIGDRIAFHPAGKIKIENELRQKGVAPKIIKTELNRLLSREKELELAEKITDKKLKTASDRLDEETAGKILRALKTRGFSGEVISQIAENKLKLEEFSTYEE